MPRCLARAIAIAMVVPALAVAEPRALAPAAKRELARGLALFETKQYAAAISAFDAGFAIDPHPDFLYAKAQAQRIGGDCRGAIATYDAFLATRPPDKEARKARSNIERCTKLLAASAPRKDGASPEDSPVAPASGRDRPSSSGPRDTPVEPEPSGAPQPPRTAEPAEAPPPPRSADPPASRVAEAARGAWWRDPPGLVLTGAGTVAVATGLTYMWFARSAATEAGSAGSLEDYRALSAAHDRDRTIAGIATGLGAALVVGAVIRFAWVGGSRSTTVAAGATAAPGTAAVWLGGAW